MFISKSGFNTPQLAVADFERQKLLVAESEKFRGEYSVACCGDSEILGNFFISFADFCKFYLNSTDVRYIDSMLIELIMINLDIGCINYC